MIMSNTLKKPEVFKKIITNDPEMLKIFHYVESISHTNQPVLITGETGVGKELIARCIHEIRETKGNLVVINVAGLDDNIFSDTLFGHTRGAFTGAEQPRRGLVEQASGGTLFLDEIGELTPASQVKLLRLLQEGEYFPLGDDQPRYTDAYIITATNENLWQLQRGGRFRKDLNFRLRTHHIHTPPLCERPEDITLLVDYFMDEAARTLEKKRPTPPKELFTLLRTYSFPGNIRELRAMVFDAISRHKSKVLSLETFRAHIAQEQEHRVSQSEPGIDEASPFALLRELPTIRQATQMLVTEAMKRANGNQSIASRMLGISQPALSKRLKNRKIEAESRKKAVAERQRREAEIRSSQAEPRRIIVEGQNTDDPSQGGCPVY
ncbi:sigma 54-interacting transcriptional regulator [Desulfococcaceae bacterium HSG8]|nr:sigma 54-interacting transcriptional regulator [Desulfococcaceae bacterium HSG8]